MNLVHSVLITGASGVGKSTIMRGALEHYGSGIIVLAPGDDERSSYLGLEGENYVYGAFDDEEFAPSAGHWQANGGKEMWKWLTGILKEEKAHIAEHGEPKRKVLVVDTISGLGRLALNATLAHLHKDQPPAAISPDGATFYSLLRIKAEELVRPMRALRGLGIHWLAASHPTEAEAKEIQKGQEASSAKLIMPDLPGGFKNVLPSFFNTVVHETIGTQKIKRDGKEIMVPAHKIRWDSDPKKVTKSRLGPLAQTGSIVLPSGAKASWETLQEAIEHAAAVMAGMGSPGPLVSGN